MDKQNLTEEMVMKRAIKTLKARSVDTSETVQGSDNHQRDDALIARALYLAATDFGPSRELQQEMGEVLARRFPEYDRLYRETDHLIEALSQGMPIKAGGPTRMDVTAFLDKRRAVKDAKDQPVHRLGTFGLDDEDMPF